MSAVLYWKERLESAQPLRDEALRVPGYNVRNPSVSQTWPRAIARQALYQDYQKWFDEEYLTAFRDVGYYQDFPQHMPKPLDELGFFATMGPFLYIVGRDKQVRNYTVKVQKPYQGRLVEVKTGRYFVRLCEHKAHCAAFELNTGIELAVAFYAKTDGLIKALNSEQDRVEAVAGAVRVSIRKIAENRKAIEHIQKP